VYSPSLSSVRLAPTSPYIHQAKLKPQIYRHPRIRPPTTPHSIPFTSFTSHSKLLPIIVSSHRKLPPHHFIRTNLWNPLLLLSTAHLSLSPAHPRWFNLGTRMSNPPIPHQRIRLDSNQTPPTIRRASFEPSSTSDYFFNLTSFRFPSTRETSNSVIAPSTFGSFEFTPFLRSNQFDFLREVRRVDLECVGED